MATEQVIQCAQACTVTVQHEFVFPLLSLTLEEGTAITGAVLVVWAVGFGIRQLIRTVNDGNPSNETESST